MLPQPTRLLGHVFIALWHHDPLAFRLLQIAEARSTLCKANLLESPGSLQRPGSRLPGILAVCTALGGGRCQTRQLHGASNLAVSQGRSKNLLAIAGLKFGVRCQAAYQHVHKASPRPQIRRGCSLPGSVEWQFMPQKTSQSFHVERLVVGSVGGAVEVVVSVGTSGKSRIG